MLNIYRNKKIIVLGAGLTGLSCVNFFIKNNIYVKLMDHRIIDNKFIPNNIDFHFGSFIKSWILDSDLIVLSPGISHYHPFLIEAKKKNIEIINDIEIFCRIINKSIIAVTGTNGKSTVVFLLYKIFKKYGLKVSLGGNIGIPVLSLLNDDSDIYILELSSFQLDHVYSLKTFCSIVLNITQDHMDRYLYNFYEYIFSKLKIFNDSHYCIVNLDDKFTFPLNYYEKNIITFGINKGDYSIFFNRNKIFLKKDDKKIINVNELYLKGISNYLNFLVSICISDLFKISLDFCLNIISSFKGLSHRFSIILKKNNIVWINDSKSTNINSTIIALNNVLLFIKNGRIWLLLGGNGKNADFNGLLKPFLLNIKNLVLCCYGFDKDILYNLIPSISYKFFTMDEAFFYIKKFVKSGDFVLLSPACSSLDQFKNYKDRGNKFISLIKKYI